MESIIISSKDISKLIVNNYLTVTEDKVVEVYNDNFTKQKYKSKTQLSPSVLGQIFINNCNNSF